jgi:predicted DNA-binding protein
MTTKQTPKTETKQVSAQIPVELHDKLEDYRWSVRLTMADLVRVAIEEYAGRHGLFEESGE